MNKKKITILGATGSIGYQTLNVIESLPQKFELNYITINKNISALDDICKRFNPKGIVIADESAYKSFKKNTNFKGEILCGSENINFVAASEQNDILLSSLVGFSGLVPTYEAIKKGITIALANKETLVSAGSLIMNAAKEYKAKILAVDSEHSAVLQCLLGEDINSVEKIILTASGGPFRNTPIEEFPNITIEQALNHPNWNMGNKITIDSATMMNKGFEIIEARWLFDLDINKIDVVVHPQSIIHSLVQFVDGSVKAQLGLPDMRIPISYALNYPERLSFDFPRLDLCEIAKLEFQKPDFEKFPCLKLAYESLEMNNNAPAIINAANEICVEAFLNGKIRFIDIPKIIETALNKIEHISITNLESIIYTDLETRKFTSSIINNIN